MGAGYLIVSTIDHVPSRRLATVRMRRGKEAIIDLLFASSGIEPEITASANDLTVLGVTVPVAAVGHLIAMKLLLRTECRPRDEDDLLALADVADEAEWQRASDAIALIQARGFGRERDLVVALATLRSRR